MEKIKKNPRRNMITALICLIMILITTASVSSTGLWDKYDGLGTTYDAPMGMPDFDQRQDLNWRVEVAGKPHWNYCGPTSAANILWYLECRHDTNGQNSYPLIERVHGLGLVHPLIEQLGRDMEMDENDHSNPTRLKDGLEAYFQNHSGNDNWSDNYDVSIVAKPTLSQIATWVSDGDPVLLQLKYWYIPNKWTVHWVTVQAVRETGIEQIKISDPCHGSHPTVREGDYNAHNNAGLVKHCCYDVGESIGLWSAISKIKLNDIWEEEVRDYGHGHITHAVIIEDKTYQSNGPDRTISITSCIPYDSDNDGNNDSATVSYNASTDMPTWGKVRAKLINSSDTTVCTNITDPLSFNQSVSAIGTLNLTLPSNQASSTYEVRLEVLDFYNESSIDDVDNTTITLTPANIYAHFWYDNEEGNKTVEFTDASYASSGCILTNWSWDFDDGSTSTEENPDHTYSYAGIYDVTLTVEDVYGNNDSKTISITVTGASPDGEFNFDSSDMQTYLQSMTVRSSVVDSDNPVPLSGPAYNYSWDMGDGTKYYTENVTHTYSKGGTYSVSMTVTDLDGDTDTHTMEYFTPDFLVQEGITDNRSLHHWSSLEDGLHDAIEGSIVYIANGTYDGGLTLQYDNLTLVGECRDNVTINASSTVFTINSDNVSLCNMTLTGGTTGIAINNQSNITLSNLYVHSMMYGVSITNSCDNIVVDRSMYRNNTYGVYASDSSNLTVGRYTVEGDQRFNNTLFWKNTRAIYLDDMTDVGIFNIEVNATVPYTLLPPPTYGIDMDDTKNVYIDSAHIFDAHTSAINIDESDFVNITGSHLEENDYGIYFTAAEDCLVAGCMINDNDQYGTVFSDVLCLDNMVVCNDFINNTAYDSSNGKMGPTIWAYMANATIGEGNHWNVSGVLFEDNDGDGIADDAMSLAGPPRSDPEDPLPVMEAYDWVS